MPSGDGPPATSAELEEPMLAVLELPGDPLAEGSHDTEGFENHLWRLVRWLADAHEGTPGREHASAFLTRLTEVLMQGQARRRSHGSHLEWPGPGATQGGRRPGRATRLAAGAQPGSGNQAGLRGPRSAGP